MKTLLKLVGMALLSVGLAASAIAGSFTAYAQAYPLPNYFSGTVTVPSSATATQSAQAFVGSVVNDGPLGNYNLFQGDPQLNTSGPISFGMYNYTVEVVPQTDPSASGYSVLTISW